MIPFIVGCALFMQMLDATVVATALPAMAGPGFDTGAAERGHHLLPAVGGRVRAGQRLGGRPVRRAARVRGRHRPVHPEFRRLRLAQDLPQLVLARIVQGMAGAMMVPVGRIILLRTVPKQDLLKAMSFLSIPALLGPVIGPPLSGFMVTYMSWHWIFLINIPIG